VTKAQRLCLQKATDEGEIVTSGIDKTLNVSLRVVNDCIGKGWLSMGGSTMNAGGLHCGWKITEAGREALSKDSK